MIGYSVKILISTILFVTLSMIGFILLSNMLYERAEAKDYQEIKNDCILFEIEMILIVYYKEKKYYPTNKELIELARSQGYPDSFGCGLTGIKEVNSITDIHGNEFIYEIVEPSDVIFYFENGNTEKHRLQSNQLISAHP